MYDMKRGSDGTLKVITNDFLKGFCKSNGISGYTSLSKSHLASLICNYCLSEHLDKFMWKNEGTKKKKETYLATVKPSAVTKPGTYYRFINT